MSILIGFAILPFINTNISTRAFGITRPFTERTDIKPVITGIVEDIYFKEGDTAQVNAVIARIRDDNTSAQATSNEYDINQRRQFIHDLQLLTTKQGSTDVNTLSSPLYKQQLNHYRYRLSDQQASLKKVLKEVEMSRTLIKEKVIAPKEMFDKEVESEKLQAAYQALQREQLSIWQQELAKYEADLSQLTAARSKIVTDKKNYEIRAPVTGIIQGINNLYPGNVVQAGQIICTISPESDLIAECYASSRNVGLIKTMQPVRFQVDAFDYNYFGILTGKIISIDNDYILVNNQPVFKVRCSFDSTQLHLKNGFTGHLKKGLSLQARFIIAERTLWQLLFDKIDDWLNPSAPLTPTYEKNNKS
ncbi:MAG: HlyD family efflux transporter periplasmic adaptor subunit [Chitinophagaceae bacterium]|nr:HlyD family efflux transporter periplasmic adaptor subunit [Chitinophagaceae bacterium]